METQKKIDYIKLSEDGVISLQKEETMEMALMPERDRERFEIIEGFEAKKKMVVTREKVEMTKNCFWIPEKTPNSVDNSIIKPVEYVKCL